MATVSRTQRPRSTLSATQVNLLLAAAMTGAVTTGLVSWAVGTEWSRLWTALHAIFGLMVLVLAPAKARGSVRTGLRRGRPTRWVSVTFGVMVVATIGLGLSHSTGLWTGVGYWTSLWSHFLLAFLALPLLLWHIGARPTRPRSTDLDRRLFLRGAGAAGVAAVTVGTVEVGLGVIDGKGAARRFTGSHEIGSGDPDRMPVVSWLNDTAPDVDATRWRFLVDGAEVALGGLAEVATPLDAALDCTGGWWSEQRWDVVPISALLESTTRSFRVVSATGYARIFPMTDAEQVYVAIGYNGRPLRRGHGAPIRLVAPGRRGPWWVKWVTTVESTNIPWWLQSPFPTT